MTTEPRDLIRNAILTLVRDSGGKVTRRPLIPSEPDGLAVSMPEPLAALAAARHLEWAARHALRTHASNAREEGRTWAEIGTALGCKPGEDYPPVGESAFRQVCSDLGGGPSFAWTCSACLKVVIDYGPGAGHPADQERGHAEGCTRLAEAVRAHDAQWEDDSDD